jgi:hypothetical protein
LPLVKRRLDGSLAEHDTNRDAPSIGRRVESNGASLFAPAGSYFLKKDVGGSAA